MRTKYLLHLLLLIGLNGLSNAMATGYDHGIYQEQKKLIALSLDELNAIEVTSVSKKPENAAHAPAAVFVITSDDIKRSGATSIPEALRMAPGIDVARIDANKWAISTRGFTSRFANKLLVLIDGRSAYTPFFSGVYWDVQDTLLEDVKRIEVIRGPGAALWGANAVNGVINIITQNATDTQGTYMSAGGGTKERVFGNFRHGGKLNADTAYRIYAKYFERSNNHDVQHRPVNDDWRMGRGGFRIDGNAGEANHYTIQGDLYQGYTGGTGLQPDFNTLTNHRTNSDTQLAGGNVLIRWAKQLNATDNTRLQLYYDYAERDSIWIRHEHNTLDLDFQHRLNVTPHQEILWGAGYRFISDTIENSPTLTPMPNQRAVHLFSLFIQDDIEIIEDTLKFVVGSKFEHNDFSGLEIQPSARVVWTPHSQHTLWGGISRAVRTPSRGERGLQINSAFTDTPSPQINAISVDIGRTSEALIAYELGYRVTPWRRVSIDLALFYNDYDKLRSLQPESRLIDQGSYTVVPLYFSNNMQGESYGAELDFTWQATDIWRLTGNYSYQDQQLHIIDGSRYSEHEEQFALNHKFSLRSSLDILPNLDWDIWLKYAWIEDKEKLVGIIPATAGINDLLTLDMRLAWRPIRSVELAVVGQNLVNDRQLEYFSDIINSASSQVERSVYGQITWRF